MILQPFKGDSYELSRPLIDLFNGIWPRVGLQKQMVQRNGFYG